VCKSDGVSAVLIGSIVTMIYPVRSTGRGSRRAVLSSLESRLDQWYIDLPDNLRYDPASKRNTPPPPVLFIHIKYWSAVLLLHRALYVELWNSESTLLMSLYSIPDWKGYVALIARKVQFLTLCFSSEQILQNANESDTASLKAFDLCQSAATYVSTIGTGGSAKVLYYPLIPA